MIVGNVRSGGMRRRGGRRQYSTGKSRPFRKLTTSGKAKAASFTKHHRKTEVVPLEIHGQPPCFLRGPERGVVKSHVLVKKARNHFEVQIPVGRKVEHHSERHADPRCEHQRIFLFGSPRLAMSPPCPGREFQAGVKLRLFPQRHPFFVAPSKGTNGRVVDFFWLVQEA